MLAPMDTLTSPGVQKALVRVSSKTAEQPVAFKRRSAAPAVRRVGRCAQPRASRDQAA